MNSAWYGREDMVAGTCYHVGRQGNRERGMLEFDWTFPSHSVQYPPQGMVPLTSGWVLPPLLNLSGCTSTVKLKTNHSNDQVCFMLYEENTDSIKMPNIFSEKVLQTALK